MARRALRSTWAWVSLCSGSSSSTVWMLPARETPADWALGVDSPGVVDRKRRRPGMPGDRPRVVGAPPSALPNRGA